MKLNKISWSFVSNKGIILLLVSIASACVFFGVKSVENRKANTHIFENILVEKKEMKISKDKLFFPYTFYLYLGGSKYEANASMFFLVNENDRITVTVEYKKIKEMVLAEKS